MILTNLLLRHPPVSLNRPLISPKPTASSSSACKLPATLKNTNYKLRNEHKKKNLISNTVTSIKCKSTNSVSKSLPKFTKQFDTNRFEPLMSFTTPDDLENYSETEPPDSSNSDDLLEYDANDILE
ncbi:hypothetical protein CDAR_495991 [Caerostris darwini]|uniref:Uncharacterized protein n=1 Tax=Caerostris darwini TaxID=1538125 RepID=A0AAV4U1Z5_9ARAC|nr:hypothetical protein CDAR_495991 [Caerostris darwini]